MMQTNDSRLIKAAKRTIRAEATLVIVIVIITSWSVFALYKLSTSNGFDFMFGFTRSNISNQQDKITKDVSKASSSLNLTSNHINNQLSSIGHHAPSEFAQPNHQLTYSTQLSNINNDKLDSNNYEAIAFRNRILQDLLRSQRELYANLGSLRDTNPISLTREVTLNHRKNDDDRVGLTTTSGDLNLDDLKALKGVEGPTKINNVVNLQNYRQRAINLASRSPTFSDEQSTSRTKRAKMASNLPSLMQLSPKPVDVSNNGEEHLTSDDSGDPRPHNDLASRVTDEPYDRQAAASNADPSESSVDSNDFDSPPSISDSARSLDNESDTITNEDRHPDPPIESEIADSQDSIDNQDDLQPIQPNNSSSDSNSSDDNSDQSSSNEDTPSDERTDDRADDESVKETSNAIDEEVDRMTQPSSGVVSQHDRPYDYGSTVQFDDSLNVGLSSNQAQPMKSVAPGSLIASFVAPESQRRSSSGNKHKDSDLQVDHDNIVVTNGHSSSDKLEDDSKKSKIPEKADPNTKMKKKRVDSESSSLKREKDKVTRQKRESASINKTGDVNATSMAPYEVDNYLNQLDIDTILEQPKSSGVVSRHSRALVKIPIERGPIKLEANRVPDGVVKRSDEDVINSFDGDEDDDYDDRERKHARRLLYAQGSEQPGRLSAIEGNGSYTASATLPNYHYITSNDTGLQELLAQKQLLDALKQSQLPPPYDSGDRVDTNRNIAKLPDHQAAGSLFSVDHGLLLYPSADEEHGYQTKSEAKKKKKHKMMKDKKKMTVAFKKGGHKKKKHKKEMKKFMKEKKFKGAKKGKKVAKGKGGQGGKKGKKLYKDKGFKKKGFKNVYHKEEFGQKKSYFDEFRDKDFKKKWKKFDDKYNYAQMKKWQAKDVKGAKKMKDHGEKFKKYDKSKWKKKYEKQSQEHSASSKKKKSKKSHGF